MRQVVSEWICMSEISDPTPALNPARRYLFCLVSKTSKTCQQQVLSGTQNCMNSEFERESQEHKAEDEVM